MIATIITLLIIAAGIAAMCWSWYQVGRIAERIEWMEREDEE